MFIKITTRKNKRSTRQYLQLVESYRDQGRVRQRVVASLGALDSPRTLAAAQRLQKSLSRLFQSPEGYVSVSTIEHEEVYELGGLWVLGHVWRKLGLNEVISQVRGKRSRIEFKVEEVVRRLVFNRCVDPLSRRGVVEEWEPEQIWRAWSDPTPYQHWLRALGYVTTVHQRIEQWCYHQAVDLFNQPSEVLFYDLTSTYFTGTEAESSAHGYSRDHRPDKVQIVIGVVTTRNGLPVGLRVFEGNTADKTTLKEMAEEMKRRFGLERTTFVGDRGLLTEGNCYEVLHMGCDVVMALARRSSRKLVESVVTKSAPKTWAVVPGQDEPEEGKEDHRLRFYEEVITQTFRARKPENPHEPRPSKTVKVRRVLVYNPAKAKDDKAYREQQIRKTEERLKEIHAMAQRSNPDRKEEFAQKIGVALARHKTKRWIKAHVITAGTGANKSLAVKWELRQNFIQADAAHDGIFVALATLSGQTLDSVQTIRSYKNLSRVEEAFREMKSQIDLRPVYVRIDPHVLGHVLICFIAYYVRRSMELMLAGSGLKLSAHKALRALNRIKGVKTNAGDITFFGSTRPTLTARQILESLEINPPPKILKQKDLSIL